MKIDDDGVKTNSKKRKPEGMYIFFTTTTTTYDLSTRTDAFGSDDDSDDEVVTQVKKRKKEEDDAFASDSDDDDDDDDDFDSKPKKKKKKTRMNMLVVDEADVDDDENDEEGEGGGMDEEALRMIEQQNRERSLRGRVFDRDADVQEVAQQLEERYKREKMSQSKFNVIVTGKDDYARPLPSVMDFDLYAVKCKEGKEREAAMTVLRKAAAQQQSGKKIHVSSVLARGTKGYIYMEAKNDDAIMKLCKGLNLVTPYYKNGLKLVEIRQRTNVLLVSQRSRPVKKGEFVRLKRPVAYKGDLAEVMEIMPDGSRCILRYIPRIDYAALGMSGAEKRARKRRVRPTQRLFSEEDALNLSVSKVGTDMGSKRFPETNEMMDFFANLYLKNGFAHKCVSIKTVTSMNVNPTIEETQMFRSPTTNDDATNGENNKEDDSDDDDSDTETKTSSSNVGRKSLLEMVKKLHTENGAVRTKRKIKFEPGDRVVCVEGELRNVKGIVVSVNVSSVRDDIVVKMDHEALDENLTFTSNMLKKHINIGEHVKIVSGTFSSRVFLFFFVFPTNTYLLSHTLD